MAKEKKNKSGISRKDFLRTSIGIVGMGLLGPKVFSSSGSKMPLIDLGKTGLKVPPICYGASRSQEASLVKAVMENGINFFDTGRSYARGQNEIMLGKAVKGIRDKVIIQSKLKVRINTEKEDLNSKETAGKITVQMEKSLNESLKALQTDYIDIMLFHSAYSASLLFHDAVTNFFQNSKKAGKIRAFGFSAHNNSFEVIEAAAKNPVYEVVMVPYNHKGSYIHSLSNQYNEWDQPRLESSLKTLHKNKVGIIAMKTCSGGPFAFKDSDKPSFRDAIKWVLNKDFIDCTNVAMGNFSQIDENIKAINN